MSTPTREGTPRSWLLVTGFLVIPLAPFLHFLTRAGIQVYQYYFGWAGLLHDYYSVWSWIYTMELKGGSQHWEFATWWPISALSGLIGGVVLIGLAMLNRPRNSAR